MFTYSTIFVNCCYINSTQRGLYVFVDFGILVDNIGANIYRKTSVLAIVADCKCPFGCCLIPCFMEKCRNVDHICPNCRSYLGTYKR
ncbi:unnamed protein product [Brassicogethes aeneus]|uniref:LITAF domain-containing protein n=1 Tax=Brassicogethes aeneus TaxID=1431903 RepID=A0A9P0ARP6_BRAAE|nr:unnamed protein product [Brassicogethes aeneus]